MRIARVQVDDAVYTTRTEGETAHLFDGDVCAVEVGAGGVARHPVRRG